MRPFGPNMGSQPEVRCGSCISRNPTLTMHAATYCGVGPPMQSYFRRAVRLDSYGIAFSIWPIRGVCPVDSLFTREENLDAMPEARAAAGAT